MNTASNAKLLAERVKNMSLMKRILACCLAALLLWGGLCFAEGGDSQWYIDGKNQSGKVHLREGRGMDTASLGIFYTGTPVQRLDYMDTEWIHVSIGGTEGFVYRDFLTDQQPMDAKWAERKVYNDVGSYTNLRLEPSTAGKVLRQCRNGETALVLGELASGWSYIELGGHQGYMMTQYLTAFIPIQTAAPAQSQSAGAWYVNGAPYDRAMMYYDASDAEPVGLFFNGTPISSVGGEKNGFVKVTIGRSTGYMPKKNVAAQNPGTDSMPEYQVAHPSSTWVHLRKGPGENTESLARLNNGTPLLLMGELQSGWSYVQTLEGNVFRTGYMMTALLDAKESRPEEGEYTLPEAVKTTVVGKAGNGDNIHAYTADNGQTLYFTAMEDVIRLRREDVNFDGRADLVFEVSMGSSNIYYTFFVWHNGRYVQVLPPAAEEGLANFSLYPEKGYVSSDGSYGMAGALYESCLYRWNGPELVLVRRALSSNKMDSTYENGVHTQVTYEHVLTLRVWDYTTSADGTIIFETTVDMTKNDEAFYPAHRDAVQAFWQGLE